MLGVWIIVIMSAITVYFYCGYPDLFQSRCTTKLFGDLLILLVFLKNKPHSPKKHLQDNNLQVCTHHLRNFLKNLSLAKIFKLLLNLVYSENKFKKWIAFSCCRHILPRILIFIIQRCEEPLHGYHFHAYWIIRNRYPL